MRQISFLCQSKKCNVSSSTFYIAGNLNITKANVAILKNLEDKKLTVSTICSNCKQKQVINITSIELQREFNLQNI